MRGQTVRRLSNCLVLMPLSLIVLSDCAGGPKPIDILDPEGIYTYDVEIQLFNDYRTYWNGPAVVDGAPVHMLLPGESSPCCLVAQGAFRLASFTVRFTEAYIVRACDKDSNTFRAQAPCRLDADVSKDEMEILQVQGLAQITLPTRGPAEILVPSVTKKGPALGQARSNATA